MPTGIYKRIKHWKVKDKSNHGGGTKGKHWKVSDTSKISEAAKRAVPKVQNTRRANGWFKNIDLAKQNFRLGQLGKKETEVHKKNISLAMQKRKERDGYINSLETRIKQRNARMKQVLPNKDTSIEKKMQEKLLEENIEFEKHKSLIGQPDIFIEPNICIFADGDYWHRRFGAKERDEYVNKKLKEQGYKVLRFWESEINDNLTNTINIIKEYAKNTL